MMIQLAVVTKNARISVPRHPSCPPMSRLAYIRVGVSVGVTNSKSLSLSEESTGPPEHLRGESHQRPTTHQEGGHD